MGINNENFNRAWTRSQESQLFNRFLAFSFVLGVAIGVYLGYYIFSKKITEQSETIERQEKLIELLQVQ